MPVGLLGLATKTTRVFGRDGGQHGVEVVAVVLGGHDDELAAEQGGDDGIDGKAVLRDDHLGAGRQERVADELDDFIGAVAEDQVGGRHAEFGGELLLQVKGVAVRVKIHLGQRLAHGGQREARGAERVFVRGELDDVVGGQAEFAGDFFDGAAGLIDRARPGGWGWWGRGRVVIGLGK